ncbi:hypothetical protein BDW02DRAFT_238953 [Decorospora gaudefroyi]|uniref:Uncharacterized protein n=1 Tax=Decorospora gaudefroyi TaxID=184978 RepID=A0A6A5JXZ7_9PLEO|nr:hypothetical protein BDW02DRAFT_238953 [Decorospora gaudefroyi]
MPTPWRRGVYDRVDYVVVEGDRAEGAAKSGSEPTATVNRILRRSHARRQDPNPTDPDEDEDEDEDEEDDTDETEEDDTDEDEEEVNYMPSLTTMSVMTPTPVIPPEPATLLVTMTVSKTIQPTVSVLANSDPVPTFEIDTPPPPPPRDDRSGRLSQTTEHLLIAAGSIGATIVIVMVVLAFYTMRKRGLSLADVIKQGKQQIRRGPPPPPSKYGMEKKQSFDDGFTYGSTNPISAPPPAAITARAASPSTQIPLQPVEMDASAQRSFYNDTPSRSNSHRRNESATPSSPILPIEGQRQSASTRNTRSLDGNEEPLQYPEPPQQQPTTVLPAPPTFRQFLSNRPSISQRPGLGGAAAGGIASRFSWTNSNAPQTPHEPSRDTVTPPVGRDSFMTQRSSVPRFRTIDSWVNQQSTRVEEQRLKQQFRMTQSTTYSDDEVPEMPAVPKSVMPGLLRNGSKSGLVGRDIKHQRHDTTTTVQTAPIFKAHPGTEVRFSTHSAVPSEILDMGRHNAAL